MQRLTYRRTLEVPFISKARDALLTFYTAAERNWSVDPTASSLFKLKLYRGNWAQPRYLKWLAGTWMSRFLPPRLPRPPAPEEGSERVPDSFPVELTVLLQPKDRWLADHKGQIGREATLDLASFAID